MILLKGFHITEFPHGHFLHQNLNIPQLLWLGRIKSSKLGLNFLLCVYDFLVHLFRNVSKIISIAVLTKDLEALAIQISYDKCVQNVTRMTRITNVGS